MIENIKRFVNEHHTLMVVVIGVLVFCFIYWWLCCKDRPSANKGKGGEVHWITITFDLLDNSNSYSIMFRCIGMNIDDSNGKYPMFALTDEGEKHLLDNILNSYNNFIDSLIYYEVSINSLFEDPIMFLFGESNSEAVAVQLINKTRLNEFIYTYGNAFPNGSYKGLVNFSFERCLNNIENDGIKRKLIHYYNKLCQSIYKINKYVRPEKFIGQPASNPCRCDLKKGKQTSKSFLAKDISSSDEIIGGKHFFWSESRQDIFNGKVKELYLKCKQHVRNWYEKGKTMKDIINYYYDDNDGVIEYSTGPDEDTDYEVADIYPAYKVLMLIILLIEHQSIFNDDDDSELTQEEFLNILAS